jgi:hypothetical protein
MRRLFSLLAAALAVAGLAACDAVTLNELKPGISTGYEVRDKLGKPGIEWRNDDGSVTWEYTRQPEGTECFMVTVGPDNVLKSIENVLTPQNFARVQPGWTGPGAPPAGQTPLGPGLLPEEGGSVGLAPAPRIQRRCLFQYSFRGKRAGHHDQPFGTTTRLTQARILSA